MLPWKLRKRQILLVNQNLSLVYFPPAKFQLVSCNLSLAMIWHMTYTHKLPKLCSATLIVLGSNHSAVVRTLVSHQCGPCSDPSIDALCGLSLLLVLSFLPRGFSPSAPIFPSSQKPTFPNSNSTRIKETKNHSVDVLPLQIHIYYLFHLANVDVGIVCQ